MPDDGASRHASLTGQRATQNHLLIGPAALLAEMMAELSGLLSRRMVLIHLPHSKTRPCRLAVRPVSYRPRWPAMLMTKGTGTPSSIFQSGPDAVIAP